MEITLAPTTSLHQIRTLNLGDAPYARLWIGLTEDGQPVQALIFGVAFIDGYGNHPAQVDLMAVELPPEIPNAYPPIVIAPRIPGSYKPD